MDDELWWQRAFAYSSFAALGGMLGHMIRTIDKQRKISYGRAVLEGCAAGFFGLLMLFTCDAMEFSKQWTGVIVGVSGWMGPSATIRILEVLIRRKLNVNVTEEPK
jgi:hypothetical protein